MGLSEDKHSQGADTTQRPSPLRRGASCREVELLQDGGGWVPSLEILEKRVGSLLLGMPSGGWSPKNTWDEAPKG